jgi:hypothetical protein
VRALLDIGRIVSRCLVGAGSAGCGHDDRGPFLA